MYLAATLALGGVGLVAAGPAAAEGWYVEAGVGLGGLADGDVAVTNTVAEAPVGVGGSGEARYDAGLTTTFAVGREWRSGWAVEVELTYRRNDLDELPLGGVALREGDFASLGFAVNGLYRFGQADARWRPYAGLGAVWLQEIDIDFEAGGTELSYESDEFALQAMAGPEFAPNPRWRLAGEVRYMPAGAVEMTNDSGRTEADYDHLGIVVGLRYRF
jgi:opacity protein-like surface antigen